MVDKTKLSDGLHEARKVSFDRVTEAYDIYRARYPRDVVEVALGYLGMEKPKVVDFGCGTGQLTEHFVNAGCKVTAVDISPNMVDFMRRKYLTVTVLEGSFDTFEEKEFDLCSAATAFHWFDREKRFAKAAEILRPGGVLMVLVNANNYEEAHDPIQTALNEVYLRHHGTSGTNMRLSLWQKYSAIWDELKASPLFEAAQWHEFDNPHRYTTETYLGLIQTNSDTQVLPPKQKESLLGEIKDVLDAQGGELIMPYKAWVFLARRI